MPHTNVVDAVPNQGWDERIHLFRNGRLVTTAAVVTDRYLVVVDTLINAHTAGQVMAHLADQLGGRHLLVVNTHADYDHCWGNQLFAGPAPAFPAAAGPDPTFPVPVFPAPAYPAPILGSVHSPAVFEHPDADAYLAAMRRDEPEIFADVVFVPPNILLSDTTVIDGGDLTLRILPTPGHTEDHMSIHIPEIQTLLAGDAAELPYPAARKVDGLPAMRDSLRRLANLGAETVLYCHAPTDIGPRLLQDNLAYFDQVEAACRAAIARGDWPTDAPDLDPIALTGLAFEDATPDGEAWHAVHPHYRQAGHADQIRTMFGWLELTT